MNVAREQFAALAGRPDARINVAEAALRIAQEEYATLDVATYLRRFDELADGVRAEIRAADSAAAQVARLNHFMFVETGFVGNHDHYYDPRNSYLNEVLDRRTGIPLTLSVVYCEVAQRLDMPVYGVGFPGHFLAKYAGESEIIIDPFFGTVITTDECIERLRGIYGEKARFDRRLLRPATAREILVRLLSNLKQVHLEQQDWERALGCADRILLLSPELPRELRDRGILYRRLECFSAALRDLRRYLQLAPNDDGADAVRAILPDLQRQVAQLQ